MKRYIQFLLCTAILLSIACSVKEHYFSQPQSPVETFQYNEYHNLNKTIDNSELPWNLILVNSKNSIPKDFEIEFHETESGETVDARIYPYLEEMFIDAVKCGHSPEITSGYRSNRTQQQLFDDKSKEFRSDGYSRKEAKELATKWVATPGFNEHETGLAIDINSSDGDSWELYDWLKDNCHKYGFILRYPDNKEDITGIKYEPWHFRYVGEEAAEYIYENNITLEEYIFCKLYV